MQSVCECVCWRWYLETALQRPAGVDWRPRPLSACIRVGSGIRARHLPCGWHLSVFDGPPLVTFSKRGTKPVLFEWTRRHDPDARRGLVPMCACDLFLLDLLATLLRSAVAFDGRPFDVPSLIPSLMWRRTRHVFKPKPNWRDGVWIDVHGKYILVTVSVSSVELFFLLFTRKPSDPTKASRT